MYLDNIQFDAERSEIIKKTAANSPAFLPMAVGLNCYLVACGKFIDCYCNVNSNVTDQ